MSRVLHDTLRANCNVLRARAFQFNQEMPMKAQSQPAAVYALPHQPDDDVIQRALRILESRLRVGASMSSPQNVKDYLRLQLAGREHEVFGALWLDSQHQVIAFEEMFRGTLSQASVYPREVVKSALRHNAGAVVLSHNHPSGLAEPSRADEMLTSALKSALALVDVRVLDHVVVAAGSAVSMAERGLI